MNWRNLATVATLAVVMLAALAAGVWVSQSQVPPAAVTRLQALTLDALAGQPQPLSQWRGKVWVVNFWATWCAPCREEMPMLATLARKHEGSVQFLGIGLDAPEALRAFAREVSVPYPLLASHGGVLDLTAALGNQAMALPFTVVLDAHGYVVARHMGKVS